MPLSRIHSTVGEERLMRPINNVQLLQYDELYRQVIVGLMGGAKKSIKIASSHVKNFRINHDTTHIFLSDFLSYLIKKRNVSIQLLITANASKSRLFDTLLLHQNVEIRLCARNHLKLIIVDSRKVYCGSANLTTAGLGGKNRNARNFELGFISENRDLVQALNSLFSDIWQERYCERCRYKRREEIRCSYTRKIHSY